MAVTVADVKLIVTTSLSDPAIEFFIGLAEAATAQCATGWSDDLTDKINTLVAAHFIETSPDGAQTVTSVKLGDASETYLRSSLGEGLKGSMWGKQALLLDTTGCLQRLGNPRATLERI